MKKLINKLFERLGYVPKEYAEKELNEISLALNRRIIRGQVKYHIEEDSITKNTLLVIATSPRCYEHRLVASFFDKDKEYAKLCAEELCEMLNQKI